MTPLQQQLFEGMREARKLADVALRQMFATERVAALATLQYHDACEQYAQACTAYEAEREREQEQEIKP